MAKSKNRNFTLPPQKMGGVGIRCYLNCRRKIDNRIPCEKFMKINPRLNCRLHNAKRTTLKKKVESKQRPVSARCTVKNMRIESMLLWQHACWLKYCSTRSGSSWSLKANTRSRRIRFACDTVRWFTITTEINDRRHSPTAADRLVVSSTLPIGSAHGNKVLY